MKRLLLVALLVGCGTETPQLPTAVLAERTEGLRTELVALRRDLHSHPELSNQESRTAGRVAERLRSAGLEVHTGVGGHGVVGILRGAHPGPVVGYRADMDAMPGEEPPGREYGSTVPGVFHVCGHDLHTTIGVGVATVLASMRDELRGTSVPCVSSSSTMRVPQAGAEPGPEESQ